MSDTSLAGADLERWVGQVNAALDRDDLPHATELAEAALAQGVEHPFLLNLKAFRLEQQGRFEEARSVLRRALQLSPGDPIILNSIGFCFTKEGRPVEAARAFDAVLETNPDFALPHHGRGLAWESLGDDEAARRHHERASELDPNYPDPLGALAALAWKRKDAAAARSYAERALQLDPHQSAAALTLATLQADDGDYEAAIKALDHLLAGDLAPLHRAAAERLRADALDALGQPEAAMAAYVEANAALRSVYAAQFEAPGVETGVDMCRRLGGYFEQVSTEAWRGAPGDAAQAGGSLEHVFLVGFPRSGTTLLEQVLASHPSVAALEEKPLLGEAVQTFFQDAAGLDKLAALGAAEADRWRRSYWEQVRDYGVMPNGKVFVDKQPFSTPWLPLIAKLFPEAKILFARRDPRDVVVSCFRRRFGPTPVNYEFTDLTRAAQLYGAVMELAEVYRAKLALPEHIHRHEDLVQDFDREAKAVCGFLGLSWDPAMRDFAETAKRRDVRTPSARQVERGLYSEGVGQWRRYGAAIEPILPILQPWVERFGYPAE